MVRKQRGNRQSQQLVLGYLERISSKVFSEFPRELTDLVCKQHGVYALYKGARLYYVGLAANLRYRIRQHLRDRHGGKWDKFSLYLVRKADHVKELESLVLRIADPTGNATKGRLPRAENLRSSLEGKIRTAQDTQRQEILGLKRGTTKGTGQRKPRVARKKSHPPTLAAYTKKPFAIRATYKGKTCEARVRSSGQIFVNNVLYNSPSMAGKELTGHAVDGWRFWRYKDKSGRWVQIDELRKSAETKGAKRTAPLKAYAVKPFKIRATYKGKTYQARVGRTGEIFYDGTAYNSPSMAGKELTGHSVDGWRFWRYKNEQGDWVLLDELRKK